MNLLPFVKTTTILRAGVLTAIAALAVACATEPAPLEKRVTRQSRLGDGERWQPVESNATGTYEGLNGEGCSGGLKPGTKQLGEQIKQQFGTSYGGYSCRANTANPKELSIHAVGRALDITTSGSAGEQIANFLVTNASTLGVQLIIWNHTLWKVTPSGATSRAYTGPNPHTDHVHAEVNTATAANGPGQVDGTTGPGTNDPNDPMGTGTDAGVGDPNDPNGDPMGTNPPTGAGGPGDPMDPGGYPPGPGAPYGDEGEEMECRSDMDCDPNGIIMCDQGYCIF